MVKCTKMHYINKRVTLVGSVGLGNNWNDDNRRRNFNANNDWSNDAEMTLIYMLWDFFIQENKKASARLSCALYLLFFYFIINLCELLANCMINSAPMRTLNLLSSKLEKEKF